MNKNDEPNKLRAVGRGAITGGAGFVGGTSIGGAAALGLTILKHKKNPAKTVSDIMNRGFERISNTATGALAGGLAAGAVGAHKGYNKSMLNQMDKQAYFNQLVEKGYNFDDAVSLVKIAKDLDADTKTGVWKGPAKMEEGIAKQYGKEFTPAKGFFNKIRENQEYGKKQQAGAFTAGMKGTVKGALVGGLVGGGLAAATRHNVKGGATLGAVLAGVTNNYVSNFKKQKENIRGMASDMHDKYSKD